MKKNKKILISILISILIICELATACLAVFTPVTDENLDSALQAYASSEANSEKYNISVENNNINLVKGNEKDIVKYDLTDKPTFIYEFEIKKGMSYADFEKQKDNLILPSVGYVAVAKIQDKDIKPEDANAYLMFSYMNEVLKNPTNADGYMIVDDLNLSDGITIEKNDDPKTIYTSEFGERVMEFVTNVYKEKQTFSDVEDMNSYVLTVERLDTTDTSCRLVSTLVINKEADFSKLKGYYDKIENGILDKNITKENADFVTTLKVGQKCKIETNQTIDGYAIYGGLDFNKDSKEFTATSTGVKNGYVMVGNTRKTFYITVEENSENKTYEPKVWKINATIDNGKGNTTNIANNGNANNVVNNTTDKSQANKEIPKTGSNYVLKRGALGIIFIATTALVCLVMYDKRLGMKDETK